MTKYLTRTKYALPFNANYTAKNADRSGEQEGEFAKGRVANPRSERAQKWFGKAPA
jgi:hypothetical protein